MKSGKFIEKISLFSEIVKIILESFWKPEASPA